MWLTKMALLMQTRKHLFSGFLFYLPQGEWDGWLRPPKTENLRHPIFDPTQLIFKILYRVGWRSILSDEGAMLCTAFSGKGPLIKGPLIQIGDF